MTRQTQRIAAASRRDTHVAVLGIGRMGARIARRLLSLGLKVSVWSRTHANAEELAAEGAIVCERLGDAVREATAIVICVRDGAAVAEILFTLGAADAARPGTIFIDMSSIQPQFARDHARRLARRKIGYVDAPASGGVVGAEAGTLLIMVGGAPADIERASRILGMLGRVVVGGGSGAGQIAKIANQLLMGATAGALAESLLLAEANGVDPERVVEALRRGLVHSRALELYARRILARDFRDRGAGAGIQLKDLEAALAEGEQTGVALPLSRLLEELYRRLIEDFGDLDKSSLYLLIASLGRREAETAREKQAVP